MNILIDVVALLLLVVNVWLGWKLGVVNRAIAFAGLYGGVAAATFAGNGLAKFFHGSGTPNDLYAAAWTFLAVVAIVQVMLEILGALYHDRVRQVTSLMFDRVIGALAGGALAVLQVSIICLVALAVGDARQEGATTLPPDRTTASDAVRHGEVGRVIDGMEPGIRRMFAPALPSDLSSHLVELAAPSK